MLESRHDLLAFAEPAGAGARRIVQVGRWRRRSLTERRTLTLAASLASRLAAAGAGPGSRVGLRVPDGPLWVAAFYGILRAGGVAVPIDSTLAIDRDPAIERELDLAAWVRSGDRTSGDDSLRRCVRIDWQDVPGTAPPPMPLPADDPQRIAEIVLTSGTSGPAQAVHVTHRNLRAAMAPILDEIDRHARWQRLLPRVRIGVALPLSHLYGQVMGLFIPHALDADALLLPALPASELARTLRETHVSVLSTVPHTLAQLARHLRTAGEERWGSQAFDRRLRRADALAWYQRWMAFAPLRTLLGRRFVAVVSGGAALDPDVEDFWKRLGYVVVQGYGLTEAAPLVTLNHPFRTERRSLGRPLPGVQVRIAADGEILVRGANVVPRAAGTDAGGWLHTGDLGRLDDEGRLFFVGRHGDRIVTPAGLNVDTAPIVAALRARAGILDAVVTERPWGARGTIAAIVVAPPGVELDSAVDAVNAGLPDAARIRTVLAWPGADFPRTPTGKVQRAPVRAWLERQAPAGAAADRAAGPGGGAPAPASTDDGIDRLRNLIREVLGDAALDIDADVEIRDVLTSIDRVELASALERTYGVSLADDGFEGARTVRDVARDLVAHGRRASGAAAPEPADAPGLESIAAEGSVSVHAERPPAVIIDAVRRTAAIPEHAWRMQRWARACRALLREGPLRAFVASAIRIDAEGVEQVTALQLPFILASNHLSILDAPAALFALPPAWRDRIAPAIMWRHFETARGGALQYWLAVLGLNAIPLAQAGDWRATLRIAGRLADRSICPLVYPEGRRSDTGRLGPLRSGVAVMALELDLPIVPLAVAGLHEVMPRGARWPRRSRPRPWISVRFGAPLAPPRTREAIPRCVAELRVRIEALHRAAIASGG